MRSTEKSCGLCDSEGKPGVRLKTAALGWAPGQGGAALPSLENPDSGLLRWSCQNSQKRIPLEASVEIPVVLGGFLLLL